MIKPTASELAIEVTMLKTAWGGAVMFVEGYSDCRLYEKFLKTKNWRFIPTGGWETLVRGLDILANRGIRGVLGVVDRDFRIDLGELVERNDLLATDKHDLEMMMYESGALDAVILEVGSEIKVAASGGISGIRKHLYQQAKHIAFVRLSNEANKNGYCFKELRFGNFVDRDTASVIVDQFIMYLRMRWPQNTSVSIADHKNGQGLVDQLPVLKEDAMLCRGHDVSEILAIGLRTLWGTNPRQVCRAEDLERMLRLAYDSADFCETELFKKIKKWHKNFEKYAEQGTGAMPS